MLDRRDAVAGAAGAPGGTNGGANISAVHDFSTFLINAIDKLRGKFADESAIARVRDGLVASTKTWAYVDRKQDFHELKLAPFNRCLPPEISRGILEAIINGAHLFVPVSDKDESGQHCLGLSFALGGNDVVEIGIINSNGWIIFNDDHADKPVMVRHASKEQVEALLQKMVTGIQIPVPDSADGAAWGGPLLGALTSIDAIDQVQVAPLSQPPQKSSDCTVECQFAFLAHALHTSDYKLLKATALRSLKEFSQDDNAANRLMERAKSAFNGYQRTR